ncbi:MAG: hypothetical protein AAFX53_13365, partial [Bacteroidota bacterium]
MKENALIRWVKGNKQKVECPPDREGKGLPACEGTLKLVEGDFSPAEAADVLLSLINDKIKFHTVQALNLKEGYQEDTSHSEQRIKELKEAKKMVKDLVIKAQIEGLTIEINSPINIR